MAPGARRRPQGPFFAWLHLYDPHEPYRPPRPFRDLFADSPYDGEIAFDDAIVAAVLDRLGRLGQRERTLVAVIADHGESLGEHGEETHSMFVYESALRVPLMLWRPGRVPGGRVVREPVRAIDLAPTLLELLGAPPLDTPHGRSLVPLIEGGAAAPPPADLRRDAAAAALHELGAAAQPAGRALEADRRAAAGAVRPRAAIPAKNATSTRAQPQTARALQAALGASPARRPGP